MKQTISNLFSIFTLSLNLLVIMHLPEKVMEIKNPRRILVLGRPDCDISRVVKGRHSTLFRALTSQQQHRLTDETALTGSAPTPDPSTGSLAGVTHEWDIRTAYYTADIPIWIDEITDVEAWKAEFLKPEAKEVVDALGAWIYCFDSSKQESENAGEEVTISEQAEQTMKAVDEVVKKACGIMWDGTKLAMDLTSSNKGKRADAADEICLDFGFDYVHIDAEGKNDYGEKLGLERAKEVLEANEWSALPVDDDDDEDNVGDMDDEQAQMNAELWGMKASLLDPDNDDDEDEGSALQIEGMEQMMSQLMAIREHTAGMPENERKRYATRAVDDLMKNFD
ncbi:hypothetical protein KCU92_g6822, partial [Aureobasidium melanogenum]